MGCSKGDAAAQVVEEGRSFGVPPRLWEVLSSTFAPSIFLSWSFHPWAEAEMVQRKAYLQKWYPELGDG